MDPQVELELQRMCSSEKKVDFLDALHCYRQVLDCIPLPEGSVDPFQTRKDTMRENVVLNGVKFLGEEEVEHLRNAMKAVVLSANMSPEEAEAIAERVLCSTSRTASGADSYFMLNNLFVMGRTEILLKPRTEPIPPIKIEMRGGTGNSIRCKVSTTNLYGLYRMEDIDLCTVSSQNQEPAPWVMLDTIVTDNLSFTPSSRPWFQLGRSLSIRTPEPAPKVNDEIAENF